MITFFPLTMELNTRVIKEPRGFIRILQLVSDFLFSFLIVAHLI